MKVKIVNLNEPEAAKEFTLSLREIGFAVLSHHPVSSSLIASVYDEWFKFFRSDQKYDFPFSTANHDGFVSTDLSETAKGYSAKDLKEFFHYYPWGRCPQHLQVLTNTLYEELNNLAQKLLNFVEMQTPTHIAQTFSIPLSSMIEQSNKTLFRIIHYPPLSGDEPKGALRAAAHEDINLLTLLPAATGDGLQVQNQNGTWQNVPCNEGWIIVNTGDMLQECSGAFYPATTHRVLNPNGPAAKQSRLALPLFLHPRDDVRLSARHTAKSFRHERFTELGLI